MFCAQKVTFYKTIILYKMYANLWNPFSILCYNIKYNIKNTFRERLCIKGLYLHGALLLFYYLNVQCRYNKMILCTWGNIIIYP